ncbi:MAG: nitrate ABC transporter permease [Deltaproteobacteria bacterium]|jgi:ABC-type nitrate/sulfonate/bicarbonate transport system permease component|nr:nitrate ABC transporter permease [Deltaproteobacteria bacterium]|tara:strand:- start:154 stop:891 length:738 start_codon:yes stop_codon:yes gene_type:complete
MVRRIVALSVALAVWHIAAVIADSVIFPAPLACLAAAQDAVADGSLQKNTMASLTRVGVGYAVAATLGVFLGALSGILGVLGLGFRDVLELLRPIPPIAWVPIAILWFGLGDKSAWFVVFLGAFFPIFVQVAHAFANCPEEHLEVARAYESSPFDTFVWVRLPAAAPDIAQGLRVGLGLAWTSVIAAELVGVKNGLGDRIQQLRYVSDYEGMLVCMIVIGLLGWLMTTLANLVQQRVVPWQKSSV